MEDPIVRARAPATIRRVCERGRLERQFMSDAYECLVPIVRRFCGERREGALEHQHPAAESKRTVGGRVSCAGGGL